VSGIASFLVKYSIPGIRSGSGIASLLLKHGIPGIRLGSGSLLPLRLIEALYQGHDP
jgi:hypothetical protein